jgi:hypothetical protein
MQWWNDLVTWFDSSAGWRVFSTAILPFIAIIVAGLLAAWIGRTSARRVLDHQDRELKAAAIMALIGAGRKATIWSSLGADEKQHVDSLISEADMRVRLLPVNGAASAADWAAHELGAMKKNSATFSFQAEQTFIDYRDRLLEWQDKPKRARRLFAFDLEQWRYDDDSTEQHVAAEPQQPKWGSTPAAAEAPVVPAAATAPIVPEAPIVASAPSPAGAPSAPSPAGQPSPATPTQSTEAVPSTEAPAGAAGSVASPAPVIPAPLVPTPLVPTSTTPVDVPPTAPANGADADDADVIDDPAGSFAAPITAGTVRRRTGTEPKDEDR